MLYGVGLWPAIPWLVLENLDSIDTVEQPEMIPEMGLAYELPGKDMALFQEYLAEKTETEVKSQ